MHIFYRSYYGAISHSEQSHPLNKRFKTSRGLFTLKCCFFPDRLKALFWTLGAKAGKYSEYSQPVIIKLVRFGIASKQDTSL